jgi:hypothetical protein
VDLQRPTTGKTVEFNTELSQMDGLGNLDTDCLRLTERIRRNHAVKYLIEPFQTALSGVGRESLKLGPDTAKRKGVTLLFDPHRHTRQRLSGLVKDANATVSFSVFFNLSLGARHDSHLELPPRSTHPLP